MGILGFDEVVIFLVLLGLLDHALYLVLGGAFLVVRDDDLVLLSGRLLGRGHVEDAVRVNDEDDLDLGVDADIDEIELADQVVVERHVALSLEDTEFRAWLVAGVERHGFLRGYGLVAHDERRHDSAGSLDAEGQRGDVEQEQLLLLLGLDDALDGGSEGDRQVGAYGIVYGFTYKKFARQRPEYGVSNSFAD